MGSGSGAERENVVQLQRKRGRWRLSAIANWGEKKVLFCLSLRLLPAAKSTSLIRGRKKVLQIFGCLFAPSEEGDSPQCGEMSRSDKGDGRCQRLASEARLGERKFFDFPHSRGLHKPSHLMSNF